MRRCSHPRYPRRHHINQARQAGKRGASCPWGHTVLLCAWLAGNGQVVTTAHRRMGPDDLRHLVLTRWADRQISHAILGETLTTEVRPRPAPFPVDIHPGLAE